MDKEEIKETQQQAEPPQETPSQEHVAEAQTEENTPRRERKKRHNHHDENTQKVQELGEKLAELNDKYIRLYSEYENYRKRTNTEKADLILNGGKEMIKVILPVVDDLERALAALPDGDSAKEGVTLIYNKLMGILQQKGLSPIEARGKKFDENLHEAITQFPATNESQKGTVVDVVEKGYFLNGKVLRYAKVVVAV